MAWRVLLALHSFGSATQQGVGVWDAESWQSAGSSFGSYGAYDPEDSGHEHRYYVHKGERIQYHPDQEEPLEAQGFQVPYEKACMDACDNDTWQQADFWGLVRNMILVANAQLTGQRPGAVSDGMVRALSSSAGVSSAVATPKFVWITFCCASARSADGWNL
ncbi:YPTC1 [Symbiodinium sp. CCMP2456]|nr:YPTC1 [Symbiodinium sp. CCMP2456]